MFRNVEMKKKSDNVVQVIDDRISGEENATSEMSGGSRREGGVYIKRSWRR